MLSGLRLAFAQRIANAKRRIGHLEPSMLRSSAIVSLILVAAAIAAADPCKSGPQPNQRPGPYSSLVCVGKERGTQHCYICESADQPIILVVPRALSDPLGKLVKGLDGAVKEHKMAELRSWVTFLADDQTKMDPLV